MTQSITANCMHHTSIIHCFQGQKGSVLIPLDFVLLLILGIIVFVFGLEEEQIDVDNVRTEELLSAKQFGSIPLDVRWKYKAHPSKDKCGRPQFYRYVPNHRFTLLSTWGGAPSSAPGFFRFPRSVSTFDWVLNENIDKNFDAKQAKKFVHYLAVLDSGNDRMQLIEYHGGYKNRENGKNIS